MTDNLKGILAIMASAAGFVGNDTLVKLATDELPTGEIIFIRGVFATVLIGFCAWWFGHMRPLGILTQPAMAIRIVAAALSTLFIVMALRNMPLATVTAVLQVTPLAVTAGSALLLGAAVGWRRWLASLVGFAGVLMIVKPGAASFEPAAWLALIALAFTTTRDLTTRFIDHSVPSLFVAFASSGMVMLAGLALLPIETWVAPSPRVLSLLAAASVFIFIAYYLGIVAMRVGEIAVVAPFRYSVILLALLLGYAIWGHVPDAMASTGILVIVLAGLYLLTRERAAMRAKPPLPAAQKGT